MLKKCVVQTTPVTSYIHVILIYEYKHIL